MHEFSTPSGGGKYAATGVMEIVYEEDCDSAKSDAWRELPDYQEPILQE